MSLSYWDGAYRNDRKIWGRRPTETALAAEKFVALTGFPTAGKRLLEVGCGYGRDAYYLASRWKLKVTAVDSSRAAVEMAAADGAEGQRGKVEFREARFQDVSDGPYDLVYAANLYQILPPEERKQFIRAVQRLLAPAGLFILGTLSSRDPQHSGKGTAVPGDPNSWIGEKYLHLSDRRELESGFHFLTFRRFFEQEYLEPRASGVNHHHVSWILIASNGDAGRGGE
jgi:SAM-dependent methyltransferase